MAQFNIDINVNNESKITQLKNNIGDLDKANKTAKTSSDGLASSLKSIGIAAGSYIAIDKLVSSFIGLASSVITTASEFEKFSTILTTMYGNSVKAEESMRWLKDFSEKTPYTLKQTTDAFIKLKAYGIDGTDGALQTLGDTAAAMGKDLIQSVEAMADAMVGENERLKEFGIRASAMGKTVGYEWTDASGKTKHIIIENNKQTIKSTLEAIFNSKYAGAMDDLSKTWIGTVSNLSDKWDAFKISLVDDGTFASLKNSLGDVVKELDGLLKNKDAMDGFRNAFVGVLGAVVSTIGFFGKAIIQAQGWSGFFSMAWTVSINKIQEVINSMVLSVAESFLYLYEKTNSLTGTDFYSKQIANTKAYIKELQSSNRAFIAESTKAISQQEQTVKQGDAAQKVIDNITKAIKNQTVAKKENIKEEPKIKVGVVGALNGGLNSSKADAEALEGAKKLADAKANFTLHQIDLELEADKDRLERWDNYANYMSKMAEQQIDSEIKADEKEFENKKKQSEILASLFSGDMSDTQSLNAKYDNIIQQMGDAGSVTNEQYESIGQKYLSDLKKIEEENVVDLIKSFTQWGGVAKQILTDAFATVYDVIRETYKPLIESNKQLAFTNQLQANMYSKFGFTGTGKVSDYKGQIASIGAQKQELSRDYELMTKSMDYKKILQPLFETAGIAIAGYSALTMNAGGIISGLEFALGGQKLADEITSFSKYQNDYIQAVATFKNQMRELANTLVDVAASVYDAIPSFRTLFDSISGTNTYQIQSQIEALKYVKQYTKLDKTSLTGFVNDVLTAQSDFVTGAVDIAGSTNEELIQSVDIFSKYGLAVDSLNEKFTDSLDVVANLIKSNDEANNSIKDFAKSIKDELSGIGDKKTNRMESTRNFYQALQDYRSGNIEASKLLEFAGSVKGTLSSSGEFKSLVKELENVARPQSTEDLLTKLTNQIANIQTVGLPVVNIASAQSVDAQTLDAIKDTNSLIQTLLDFLKDPLGSIVDFLTKIIEAIAKAALSIVEGIAKAVIDLVRGLGKAFLDAIKSIGGAIGDAGTDIWHGITGGIADVFGWAEGGYTGYNNGQIDSTGERVAGIVHEGEWVMPRWMVQSNSSLVSALENARVSGSTPIMSNVLIADNSMVVNALMITNSHLQNVNVRLASVESGFRTVTNGYNAMMIEVI